MGIRSGEGIYMDDDGNFKKHYLGPLEGEDRDSEENDTISRDDESFL
jgi:hypothetical protein